MALLTYRIIVNYSALITLAALSACAPLNSPYYPPNGSSANYPNQYPYGNQYPYDQNNSQYENDRRERRELERERERLERERERLEEERNREASRPPPPPPPRPAPERCPSGFSPSEQKCSREERRRGCQDMRLPGGLGCVRR
jgi:hypothetical protein